MISSTNNTRKSPTSDMTKKDFKIEILFYGKNFIMLSAIFSIVWILGYLQINVLWGIIGILTFVIYRRIMNNQKQMFDFGLDLSRDLKYTIDNNISNLPSWVFYPDVERVEWINKVILRLWPNITKYLNKIIRQIVLKKIQKKLSGVKLKEIYFGDIPPKIGGVKIYDNENMNREDIIMDVEIFYYSPAEITCVYNQLQFGIKSLEVKARLRIEIGSLIPSIPFFGSISLTLLQNPDINFEFTDLVSIFNMPGLRSLLREGVDDLIAKLMVLPNRINIVINKDIDKTKFMFHVPDGVLRIHVIEASGLKAMDVRLFESKTSDPYMIIRVGAEKFKTKVINSCLNPKWNEMFEAIVDTRSCQKVELELYDKDKNNKDDFLGRVSFDVDGVYDRGIFDTWLQLEDVNTGSVHLNLTWLELSSDPNSFDLEEERIKNIDTHYSVGFLYISVDSAKNLCKPCNEEPDSFVTISLGNQTRTTKTKKKTVNPIWEIQYNFLIASLLSAILNIQVKDEKSKRKLGNCSFKVDSLLNEPNMESFLTLKMENTNGYDSSIQIYVALRALFAKKTRSSTFSRSSYIRPSDGDIKLHENKINISINGKTLDGQNIPETIDEVFESPETTNLETRTDNNSQPNIPLLNVPDDNPKVYLTLRYTTNKNMFIVVVHKILNLKTDHDVYVKLSLHPKETRTSKHRTKSMRNQSVLIYDETFEFLTNKESLQISELVLTFKLERHSMLKRNTTIGRTKIDLNGFNPTTIKSEWFAIDKGRNHKNSDSFSMKSNQSGILPKEN